jgi:carotenoid cleavage dioxygenase
LQEINFHGDGTVGAFRIKDGHVDFKNRWVRTERFVRERSARKAVFGRYRNRYTNDPEILWANGTTSNTNIVWFNGHLLALKEDALPNEMDPDTLETIGPYDFDGQYKGSSHLFICTDGSPNFHCSSEA